MITNSRILWLPDDEESRHWDDAGGSASARNPAGVRIDSESALESTVVLACARVLAESISSLPLQLYRRLADGGKEIAREHPLYRRLRVAPNSWQTSFEWLEQQVLWACLWGNAYCHIRSGEAGAVDQLIPLHPSRMKVETIENGRLRYRFRNERGTEELFTQDEIFHVRWLSDDGVRGMVPVELARDAIGLARACEIHGARFFANGARPGFVLATENDMTPDAARTLRDNWERMHRGVDRANRTAVLFGGLKPIELAGANNQESQYLETRRFQIEEICRLYRVPPHLVGDLTRSSFSNIEQQSIDFVQHTLLPWLRRFESAIARDLITDDSFFAEFDTRGLLRGDAAARAAYYQSMYNLGVASINEIRAWESLNPVEGGDLRFVQLNMQTLDAAATMPQPAAEMPAPAADTPAAPADAAPQDGQPPAAAVADISLNGAQITGLLEILTQLSAGIITPAGAAAVIAASFPSIQPATIQAIIAGTNAGAAAPPVPAPAPAVRRELRAVTISIDYDRTFAREPDLWGKFAEESVRDGNTVVMISRREDTPANRDEIASKMGDYAAAFSKVILCGPDQQKADAAIAEGVSVDVWVDDSPQTIPSKEK